MKLLVITQKVNKNDSNLGFFHEWLLRLAGRVEKLTVICLEKGEYTLPDNVTVLSLGKERNKLLNCYIAKLLYCWRFYKFIWWERKNYDGVFVHMNPEYCILGGLLWRIWRKKILFWYTHKAVNWRLWLAEKFVNKIFTASKESFRLMSKKVEAVGHGIDVDFFDNYPIRSVPQKDLSAELNLLVVSRISPIKDLETVIKGIKVLCQQFLDRHILPDGKITLTIIGDPIGRNGEFYKNKLRQLQIDSKLTWYIYFPSGKPYKDMLYEYKRHDALIHTSRTGSMDKVVLEALAAGLPVITSSEAYAHLAVDELKGVVHSFPAGNYQELAKTIEKVYLSGILEKLPIQQGIDYVKEKHNLNNVIDEIINYLKI